MIVFGMEDEGNIARVLRGEKIGTLVHAGLAHPEPAQPDQSQPNLAQYGGDPS
jgi:hypothetical protein